ncbi:hypothetical protein ACIHAR_37790 [Streptomyces sp. NPDC052016]|uniref:hypothetical protein n=1 Tax=Streptomyces sp. NPDC052016 TaxID=3365680 RepID=UPI0037D2F5D4
MSERRAERWLRVSARWNTTSWWGFRARGAWSRLSTAVREGDPRVVALLSATARDAGHPRRGDAGELIAELWDATGDPGLRQVVLDSGALAPEGLARLRTAALHGRLTELWPVEQADAAHPLLSDPDPRIRRTAEETCATATGPLSRALWRIASHPFEGDAEGPADLPPLTSVLLRNPAPPPAGTLTVLWAAWLRFPDPRLLTALSSWEAPAPHEPERGASLVVLEPDLSRLTAPAARAALFRAAARTGHPLGDIARTRITAALSPALVEDLCDAAMSEPALVPFCAGKRLAPRDPVRRVVFFLLTGQLDQYRGMDPDGRLLELAYAAASRETRARLQQAMRATGGLDLVRILVGGDRRSRIPEMEEDELAYLGGQLAARGEWPQLWSMVQDVAPSTGLGLMGLFGDWAPRDEDGRRVFEMMRRADSGSARAWVRGLKDWWPAIARSSRIQFHGRVNDVSFAPDAPLLAIAGTHQVAGVVDLAQGRLVERYDCFDSSVGYVVHTGGGAFVAGERTNNGRTTCRLVRCAGGAHRVLHQEPGPFTALTLRTTDGAFAAGTRGGRLLLGAPDGTVEAVRLDELGLDPQRDWPRAVTAHLPSGRLAVLARELAVTDGTATEVVARGDGGMIIGRAVFTGPDSLVVASKRGTVLQLGREGRNLVPGAVNAGLVRGLEALPGRDEVVLVDERGRILVLDAGSLEQKSLSRPKTTASVTSAHLSPSGDFLAVGYDAGFTDLYDLRTWELPTLMTRPLVACVPADLGVVAGARAARDLPAAAREYLDLLHDLLEYRFRFDIEIGEIGDLAPLSAGEYDISL